MLTREPWLGDALRALQALQPVDAATAAVVLQMLSLPLAAPVAATQPLRSPPDDDGPPDTPDAPDTQPQPNPPAPAAVPPAAGPSTSKADVADDAHSSHRLSSWMVAYPAPTSHTPPAWLATVAPLAFAATSARPPAAPPLLPRQRQRALLAAALHTLVPEGAPDLRAIVQQLGAARPLARVPRLPRRTLRHGVDLRIDRAPWLRVFHADQQQLQAALVGLFGADRVHSMLLNGGPQPQPPSRRRLARPLPVPTPPTAPTPVLVLGDLGSGWRGEGVPPASWASWCQWALGQQRQGRQVLVLSPLPWLPWLTWRSPALPAPPAGLGLLQWGERTSLADVQRARAGQLPAPLPAPSADALDALAAALSPALVVSPALLRSTRLALGLPPEAEALLAASELVQSQGVDGLVFDPQAASRLRAALASQPGLEPALARVAAQQAGRLDGSALEETLVALALRGQVSDGAVAQVLQPALKALAAPPPPPPLQHSPAGPDHPERLESPDGQPAAAAVAADVAAWAAHAWARMPPDVQATPAARQLAFAAANRAPPGSGSGWLLAGDGDPPTLPDSLGWMLQPPTGRRQASVELRRYANGTVNLVIGDAQPITSACHAVSLPLGPGAWLQVQHADLELLLPIPDQGPLQVELAPLAPNAAVSLHTPWGESWALHMDRLPGEACEQSRTFLTGEPRRAALAVAPGLLLTQWRLAEDRAAPTLGSTVSLQKTPQAPTLSARVVALEQRGALLRVALQMAPADAEHLPPMDASTRPLLQGGDTLFVALDHSMPNAHVLKGLPGEDELLPFADQDASVALVCSANAGWAWVDKVTVVQAPPGKLRAPSRKGQANSPDGSLARLRIQTVPLAALAAWAQDSAVALARAAQLASADAPVLPTTPPTTPPTTLQTQATLPTPRPPGSLRARFIAMLENREDRELGLFQVQPPVPGQGGTLQLRPISATSLADNLPSTLPSTLPTDAAAPLLLFIHGITGDLRSNFGALLQDDAEQAGRLFAAYPQRVLAFQYRSLTVGPLANVLALLRAVPREARLHLVSYSGGGLIGELLCRAVDGGADFGDTDQATLRQPGAEPHAADLLDEITRLTEHKTIHIDRFVRIAAPIEGASVFAGGVRASVRLARAMPWVGTVLSALPGIDSLLTDPAVVPGSAAMVPGAPVQQLLTARVWVNAPLTVITGVLMSDTLLARAGRWVTRALAGPPDDTDCEGDDWVTLVSAFGGLARQRGVDWLIERSAQVDHAAYLAIPRLRLAVVDALLAEGRDVPPGFAHADSLERLQAQFRPPA